MKRTERIRKAGSAQTARLIEEIKQKLGVIESYMIWLIRADQRFRVGQRVEFSARARRCGFPKRKRSGKGVVKSIDAFSVSVMLDGYKQPHTYHHAFFNPVSGPKLF